LKILEDAFLFKAFFEKLDNTKILSLEQYHLSKFLTIIAIRLGVVKIKILRILVSSKNQDFRFSRMM